MKVVKLSCCRCCGSSLSCTPGGVLESSAPLISVVMPSYQQVAFVEAAARSVLNQEGVAVELIVMDPGSTDGSRELLRSLGDEYGERLVLHFQRDYGQSDALNKGLAMARGRILGWLNSDDRLHPGALSRVARHLDADDPRWLYGRVGMIDSCGEPVSNFIVGYKNWRGKRFSYYKLLTENFIPQMGVFWNRAMSDRAGSLDSGKDLDMDYDLWFRFARVAEPVVLSDYLADFRVHGSAKGSTRTSEQLDAAYATAREHARGYGLAAIFALAVHRLFRWRTLIVYRWVKP